MTELGDLLELLHGAPGRWQTVRVVSRRWNNPELMGEAMRRHAEQRRSHGHTVVTTRRGQGGPAPASETVTRTWVDRRRGRSRTEMETGHGDILSIRDGDRWWSYSPMGGAVSNENDLETMGGTTFDPLLDPSGLIEAFDFGLTGTAEVAGRTATTAVATPRPPDPRRGFLGAIVLGADEAHLAVDRERGVLLRTDSRIDGRTFDLNEVLDIAFDEVLGDDVFRFVSPDGSPARSPRETFARPEHVSLEEAARRASFIVLVPGRLPDGWTTDITYVPASERPRRADSVHMSFHDATRREERLRLTQTTEPLADGLYWEDVDHGGRRVLVHDRDAKVEVDGTHVRLSGSIDRDTLVAIAASLRPAPKELPPLRDC